MKPHGSEIRGEQELDLPLWNLQTMVAAGEEEAARKGPWTEQEDTQLVSFVRMFGERRWDFIAKVSGLNRTGKSCRLRWVNYLHPGLKRGRMSPQEERLVLELHSRWGNRWSRIARKLPGRTDNEIKNYWRTHTRKKAQEMKRKGSCIPSPSSSSSYCCPPAEPTPDEAENEKDESRTAGSSGSGDHVGMGDDDPMVKVWEEIASSEITVEDGKDDSCSIWYPPVSSNPLWDYCYDSLWEMENEEFGDVRRGVW